MAGSTARAGIWVIGNRDLDVLCATNFKAVEHLRPERLILVIFDSRPNAVVYAAPHAERARWISVGRIPSEATMRLPDSLSSAIRSETRS